MAFITKEELEDLVYQALMKARKDWQREEESWRAQTGKDKEV